MNISEFLKNQVIEAVKIFQIFLRNTKNLYKETTGWKQNLRSVVLQPCSSGSAVLYVLDVFQLTMGPEEQEQGWEPLL